MAIPASFSPTTPEYKGPKSKPENYAGTEQRPLERKLKWWRGPPKKNDPDPADPNAKPIAGMEWDERRQEWLPANPK